MSNGRWVRDSVVTGNLHIYLKLFGVDDRTKGWKHTFTHADLDDSSGHDNTKWIKVGIAKEGRNALAKFSISIGNAGA